MTEKTGECKLAHMDEEQQSARRFVNEVMRLTGWSLTELARRAKVAHTTLTRFMNNGDVTHTLSGRTVAKIRRAAAQEISENQIDAIWALSQRQPRNPA